MKTKDILAAMANGSILCMGFNNDGGRTYWLEPRRYTVEPAIAQQIINLPGIKPGGDGMFDDYYSQTWRLNG